MHGPKNNSATCFGYISHLEAEYKIIQEKIYLVHNINGIEIYISYAILYSA